MTGLRVVQWATGNIGSRSLRHVIEHPALTLAGVYVTSPAREERSKRVRGILHRGCSGRASPAERRL